ncbi:MAG: MOSC domain-containing protein [Tissierellia bacterium]|nr:MOSC domain-containing protein [Tissierellia bacterium]
MAKVYSICISEKTGTLKTPVLKARVSNLGIVGDAHAREGNRQITLMNYDDLAELSRAEGREFMPGDMAENIIVEGLDFSLCQPGTRLALGDRVVVEVSQIGKEDHPSIVTKTFGVSILPYKGLFCRVISGGELKVGDKVEIAQG